ncbi:MAG: helix-turn-helix transcriptional regulator [Pseudomonadota bacterium]
MISNADLAKLPEMTTAPAKLNEPLVSRLKRALERKGMTARAASIMATGAPDTIRMILIGQSHSPRTSTLSKISDALDVNFHWLATGEGSIERARLENENGGIENDPDRKDMRVKLFSDIFIEIAKRNGLTVNSEQALILARTLVMAQDRDEREGQNLDHEILDLVAQNLRDFQSSD